MASSKLANITEFDVVSQSAALGTDLEPVPELADMKYAASQDADVMPVPEIKRLATVGDIPGSIYNGSRTMEEYETGHAQCCYTAAPLQHYCHVSNQHCLVLYLQLCRPIVTSTAQTLILQLLPNKT